ncbi:hypothetical protein ABPG75_009877 [Micractinium tetrahymenae]
MYGGFGRLRHHGGGDLQAAALAEGVLPAEHPVQHQHQHRKQQEDQRYSLPAALRARRKALERAGVAGAAAELWPDAASGAASALLLTAARPQVPRVEYREAGNVVALADALNISRWDELPLYRSHALPCYVADPAAAPVPAPGSASSTGSQAGQAASGLPVQCPQGEVRLFIGIASRCCTEETQAKRDAIRRTWLQYARYHLPGVAVRFILAQPATEAELRAAVGILAGEIQRHADIIIVPGADIYRNLPSKTLQLLHYALSSECKFTHVLKTDDDVYLRPQMLWDIIQTGHYNFSVEVQHDGSSAFDGKPATFYQAPWMNSMYVGQIGSVKPGGVYPGWRPYRDPRFKWYLSEQDLPDEIAPLGVRWLSGWGYMLSRDLVEFLVNTAFMYAAIPEKQPKWWGRMPWEDIMVGAMLGSVARVHHHDGFKAAWEECDRLTVLKHLDNDAPSLHDGLYAQELSGLWSKKSVVCSSGPFEHGNRSDWRTWRNSLPDNMIGGFM